MVEFRDRESIASWLERITPRQRQNDVSVTLAARAALRVLPLIVSTLGQPRRKRSEATALVLRVFRALALAWVEARYSVKGEKYRVAANSAILALANNIVGPGDPDQLVFTRNEYNAAIRGEKSSGIISIDARSFLTVNAALDAARTASVNAVTFPSEFPARFAVLAIHNAINASANAIAREVLGSGAGSACADQDASAFDFGIPSAQLAGSPLWLEGAPNPAEQAWQMLKTALLAAEEGWEVWTDWYEARLAGDAARPPIEALEVARATIPDATWNDGPAVVNAEIKRLIAEHQSLQQRPAAFQFRVVDDKIDALPEDARPIDAETARDFYDEAKRKGQDLGDRLQCAQADENIRAHVDLLLARLGSSYAEMRPGLMISVLRSLESDVRAYDSEEGRKELAAAHLSSIFNLTESVRDLCAIFPRSREIEAEAVSLGLPMQRLPEIRVAIDSVVAKVNHSDGATEGGREAINASAADLAHQRGLAEEAKQSAYFLVDFANFTRAGVKYLKATGRAVGGEIAGVGADSWRAFRRGAPKGVERGAAQAGKALVVGGVAVLMHWLGSDIAALGAMVGPYLPLHEMLEKMTAAAPDAPAPEPDAGSSFSEDADDAPAPRPSKPRKPTARNRGKT
jgi:hypothetical protein